nr:hypothetical protein [Tanacetum cinerariifolium]
MLPPSPLFDPRDFFFLEEILPPQKRARFLSSSSIDSSAPPQHMIPPTPPRDTEPSIGSPISLSPSSLVGSSSQVRLTTPLLDYPFDVLIFAELDNSMAPKRTSTFATPAMNQATIRKLVADSVAAALEA